MDDKICSAEKTTQHQWMLRSAFLLVLSGSAAISCSSGRAAPEELDALTAASSCEVDSDCCVVIHTCSATGFAIDRSQVDDASSLLPEQDGPFDGCVKCAILIPIPVCSNGKCKLSAVQQDELATNLESVGTALCSTVEATDRTDLVEKIGCGE